MVVRIKGASEHNLREIDVDIPDGLTVVTGISGSGKTSLVFDTLYHEARRRFLDIFSLGSPESRLSPARVQSITGLGPAVAMGQNLLNRNPNSTLATASGLHPFLRLLYVRFGKRLCRRCGGELSVFTEDEILEQVDALSRSESVIIYAPLLRNVRGSHRTLLEILTAEFGVKALRVDRNRWDERQLDPSQGHSIDVQVARLRKSSPVTSIRRALESARDLGANAVTIVGKREEFTLSLAPVCISCGSWYGDLEPVHFHTQCPYCRGEGCSKCFGTGLYPEAAAVKWQNMRLPELLSHSVKDLRSVSREAKLPTSASRLQYEIMRRLDALDAVGLGYLSLDRASPTLSRGESQRVRLAVALTSRLEDMLYVLDEPTIGQHPADVSRLLQAFRGLSGNVLYVEHNRVAAAAADWAIDLGPGAGSDGGRLVFAGTPAQLWEADTSTGRYFSLRSRVPVPEPRRPPERFITIRGAFMHNLQNVDVPIPLGRLTVVTGVSGSGKSTLVEDVLYASMEKKKPVGCQKLDGPLPKAVLVDQSPIGHNPRSNPATYTKLSDIVRDYFASKTGLFPSHFSFNRPEGQCRTCNGMGAVEVKMRYLPSVWIPCSDCDGQRFSDEILSLRVGFGDRRLSIAELYKLSISELAPLLLEKGTLPSKNRIAAKGILGALLDIGLGYLTLGQPSTTLSGGEAQRIKLAKYLGRRSLSERLLILDEPSTGLHPQDLSGLLTVLDRLVQAGATIVIVEHNTDVIRAADWIIDLGAGAGPEGGRLLYAGPLEELLRVQESITAQFLRQESAVIPSPHRTRDGPSHPPSISIRGACANNLKGVSVDFPKAALTVVTGVSGSGKSSLVNNVLEAEARRRFLETLSLYERQSVQEGPEAPVEDVRGLGVAVTISPERRLYNLRSTVGTATEIWHYLAVLLATIGKRSCLKCGTPMIRTQEWTCTHCRATAPIAEPRHFSPSNYASACTTCHGVGTIQVPSPEKLIKHPEKPLCRGAMYSPGFFPNGFLCKPGNGGYYIVQALAARYRFDHETTPWNEMSAEAQSAFLFGDAEALEVTFHSPRGRTRTTSLTFKGFYGWVRDWDVGGTYTDAKMCPDCNGSRLRSEYLAVTLGGFNIHQLSKMPLSQLTRVLEAVSIDPERYFTESSLGTALKRLRFLLQVGLGYLDLNRVTATLSAGEAQRVKLAGLLGSELTSLTVILDEPSRGLHPSEIEALLVALRELRDEGNTVIVVEHDPQVIRAADCIVDMGPGPGASGGEVVAQGTPEEVARAETVTSLWMRGQRKIEVHRMRRKPHGWLTVNGAAANNLKINRLDLPLGTLIGVCGVSGSGKSTLFIDTLGRALAPKLQTTSVAREPVEPGAYVSITGAPKRAVLVDQAKAGLHSPVSFLDLSHPLQALFAESDDARAQVLTRRNLAEDVLPATVLGSFGPTWGSYLKSLWSARLAVGPATGLKLGKFGFMGYRCLKLNL